MAELQPPSLLTVLVTMTGSAPPKPYRLSLEACLRDGTRIYLRTLRPNDRTQLAKGFERLSARSRRFRFLAPLRRLTSRQLTMLTEVDQVSHVAIGARDTTRRGRPGVAVARFIRLEQEPSVAEFAVTVVDEYQRRGLGSLLIRLLLDAARKLGLKTLRGYVLPDNSVMIRLMDRFGASWSRDWGGTLTGDLSVPEQVPSDKTTPTPAS
jgi:RimJ/RimL family protein N-acetyltransferase